MKLEYKFLICMMILGVVSAFVYANSQSNSARTPLTPEQVKNFIKSLEDVEKFNAKMVAEKKEQIMTGMLLLSPNDSFTPIDGSIEALKKNHPADYRNFKQILVRYHFSTPEEWFEVADRTLGTYGEYLKENPFAADDPNSSFVPFEKPPEDNSQPEAGSDLAAVKPHLHEIQQGLTFFYPKMDNMQ